MNMYNQASRTSFQQLLQFVRVQVIENLLVERLPFAKVLVLLNSVVHRREDIRDGHEEERKGIVHRLEVGALVRPSLKNLGQCQIPPHSRKKPIITWMLAARLLTRRLTLLI